MARKKAKDDQGGEFSDFVPVIYARNLVEAEFYKGLLARSDIPALIEGETSEEAGMPASIVGQGIPVMVPDDMLDEASEILAEHEETEEDDDLDDYEKDEIEDEFDDDLDDDDIDDEDDDDLDDDDLDDLDDEDFDEDDEEDAGEDDEER